MNDSPYEIELHDGPPRESLIPEVSRGERELEVFALKSSA